MYSQLHAGGAGSRRICHCAGVAAAVLRLHKQDLQSSCAQDSPLHGLHYLLPILMPADLWPRVAFSLTLQSDRLINSNNIFLCVGLDYRRN